MFAADGTYKRHFCLETRLGGDVSGVFSAREGTVSFDGTTFKLRPAKGTYRVTEGRSKKKEREMLPGELQRSGLVFTWRLDKKEEDSAAVPMVGEAAGEEPLAFTRCKE